MSESRHNHAVLVVVNHNDDRNKIGNLLHDKNQSDCVYLGDTEILECDNEVGKRSINFFTIFQRRDATMTTCSILSPSLSYSSIKDKYVLFVWLSDFISLFLCRCFTCFTPRKIHLSTGCVVVIPPDETFERQQTKKRETIVSKVDARMTMTVTVTRR